MEQPTTSFKAVQMGSTTSHLSWPFLEPREGFWGADQNWNHRVWWQAKRRGREGKGKINLFDVMGDWFQLQKYKHQLLHFPKRYSGASMS